MRRLRWMPVLLLAAITMGCASASAQPVASLSDAPVSVSAADSATVQTSQPAAPDMRALRRELAAYLAREEGIYGITVIDLNSGATTGINQDKVFPTASTFKLPMALYILDQAAQGKIRLEEKIAYDPRDWEEGTGVIQIDVAPGARFTIRELVELAITESDNIATNMLMRRFGFQSVYAHMAKLGGKVTKYDAETIGSTPREMATYMRAAQGNVLKNAKLTQFLVGALTRTAFEDRIAAGVPQDVAVAHKIGTLYGVVNDVGLVTAPHRPFVIAVMSMDVENDRAPVVIEELTRIVYRFLEAS